MAWCFRLLSLGPLLHMNSRSIRCKCSPVDTCTNGLNECNSSLGCFYYSESDDLGRTYFEHFGCLNNNHISKLMCLNSSVVNFSCCFSSNSSNFCNVQFVHKWHPTLIAFLVPIVLFLIISFFFFLKFIAFLRAKFGCKSRPNDRDYIFCYPDFIDSGSGAGRPFLINRTISRQTALLECIGRGRFGEVWRAISNEEVVAVKIFSSRDGASWSRETQVYTNTLLSHPNILTFYASDMVSHGGCTQLWLVTAYHPQGSLHDYLSSTASVSRACGLRLARSIASGLTFLHGGVSGFRGKLPIAHRDIKSKNILVMENREACLADFGLALVKYGSCGWTGDEERQQPVGRNGETCFPAPPASPFAGTKRYMAPEVLALYPLLWGGWRNESVQVDDKKLPVETEGENLSIPEHFMECRHPLLPFEIYQSADIYSLGLVLWEIWRRCTGATYEVPYYDVVPSDPTFLQMYRVVVLGKPSDLACEAWVDLALPLQTCAHCAPHLNLLHHHSVSHTSGLRPSLVLGRSDIEVGGDNWLARFAQVIEECWHSGHAHRLSALRVRKTLAALEEEVL